MRDRSPDSRNRREAVRVARHHPPRRVLFFAIAAPILATPAASPTAEQTERLKSEVERQMQQDVLGEYVAGLQARYGFSVNDAALKQALGTPGRDQTDE